VEIRSYDKLEHAACDSAFANATGSVEYVWKDAPFVPEFFKVPFNFCFYR